MVQKVVGFLMGVFVLGTIVVAIWDDFVGTDTGVQALTGVDAGTTMLQTMWPIGLTIGAIAVAVGIIFWGLREMNIMS